MYNNYPPNVKKKCVVERKSLLLWIVMMEQTCCLLYLLYSTILNSQIGQFIKWSILLFNGGCSSKTRIQ